MISKYPGRCAACNGPIKTGDEIDYINKKAYHPTCRQPEQAELPDGRAEQLADSLGFVRHDDESIRAMAGNWVLWRLCSEDSRPTAGRSESSACGRRQSDLFREDA